jgi:hypothetical protein
MRKSQPENAKRRMIKTGKVCLSIYDMIDVMIHCNPSRNTRTARRQLAQFRNNYKEEEKDKDRGPWMTLTHVQVYSIHPIAAATIPSQK